MANTKITADQAVEKAYSILRAGNTAYSMPNRMQHAPFNYGTPQYYDCSSFVGTCWGFGSSCPGTASMPSSYAASGFDVFHFNDEYQNIQFGDIVVWQARNTITYGANGHTMIYVDQTPGKYIAGLVIHCSSVNYPNQWKGGVQTRSGIMPDERKIDRERSYIIRGTSGLFIVKVTDGNGNVLYDYYNR